MIGSCRWSGKQLWLFMMTTSLQRYALRTVCVTILIVLAACQFPLTAAMAHDSAKPLHDLHPLQ